MAREVISMHTGGIRGEGGDRHPPEQAVDLLIVTSVILRHEVAGATVRTVAGVGSAGRVRIHGDARGSDVAGSASGASDDTGVAGRATEVRRLVAEKLLSQTERDVLENHESRLGRTEALVEELLDNALGVVGEALKGGRVAVLVVHMDHIARGAPVI